MIAEHRLWCGLSDGRSYEYKENAEVQTRADYLSKRALETWGI